MSGASQTAPPSLLPNLVPSALVISGVVSTCTLWPSTLWIRSTPESRLPHWSLPPVCRVDRSEEHTSELQSRGQLVCRLLLEKKTTYPETMLTIPSIRTAD